MLTVQLAGPDVSIFYGRQHVMPKLKSTDKRKCNHCAYVQALKIAATLGSDYLVETIL